MSARQRKRREKARRRGAKVLAIAHRLVPPIGCTLYAEPSDYGQRILLALQDEAGVRVGVALTSKRWKWAEHLPAVALAKLTQWTEVRSKCLA